MKQAVADAITWQGPAMGRRPDRVAAGANGWSARVNRLASVWANGIARGIGDKKEPARGGLLPAFVPGDQKKPSLLGL